MTKAPKMPEDLRAVCSLYSIGKINTNLYKASTGSTDYYLIDLLLEVCSRIVKGDQSIATYKKLTQLEEWVLSHIATCPIDAYRGIKFDCSKGLEKG